MSEREEGGEGKQKDTHRKRFLMARASTSFNRTSRTAGDLQCILTEPRCRRLMPCSCNIVLNSMSEFDVIFSLWLSSH